MPGHGSRDCKLPRSPTSVDELRRPPAAGGPSGDEVDPSRRLQPSAPRSAERAAARLPPPPPPPPAVAWLVLPTSRIEVLVDRSMEPVDLCIMSRLRSMVDLERRLQFGMFMWRCKSGSR
ncbi:hypothetical protein ZWY2020_003341 [Hordeum vulgare]|nr:hypothetical protein ZWY2020_054673 [Hordeum vulgare]KAI4972416.1 hypothetical protein ZWY2020_003341 [Hordeum vulgare]